MRRVREMLRQSVITAIAVLAAATSVVAQEAPAIPKELTVLSTEQLKKMLDGKEKFVLVDARNNSEYREGYIPTAINIYDKEMEANRAKLPADKNQPVVFYCNGYPKCVRSLNGAKMALSWGYTKVYLHVAGFPDWQSKGYPVERQ